MRHPGCGTAVVAPPWVLVLVVVHVLELVLVLVPVLGLTFSLLGFA